MREGRERCGEEAKCSVGFSCRKSLAQKDRQTGAKRPLAPEPRLRLLLCAFHAARDHVTGALQGGEAEHELPPRGAELRATLQLTERGGRPGHGALVCDVSAP